MFVGTHSPNSCESLVIGVVHIDYCALPREIDTNVACWVTQPTRKCFQENTARTDFTFGAKNPFELRSILCIGQEEGYKVVNESKGSRYGNVIGFIIVRGKDR